MVMWFSRETSFFELFLPGGYFSEMFLQCNHALSISTVWSVAGSDRRSRAEQADRRGCARRRETGDGDGGARVT